MNHLIYTQPEPVNNLNGPQLIIYYDESDVDIDGNGWNLVYNNGSVAYRFPTLEDVALYLQKDGPFWTKELMKRFS